MFLTRVVIDCPFPWGGLTSCLESSRRADITPHLTCFRYRFRDIRGQNLGFWAPLGYPKWENTRPGHIYHYAKFHDNQLLPKYLSPTKIHKTRRALGGAHVPPTKVFRRLTGSVNKTIVKPRLAAAANTYTSDFPDVKFRVAARYHSGESNPVPASGL